MIQATGVPMQAIHGQATALLVIDVQHGLFRKSTPIYRAEPLLNTIATLIDRAHAADALVVYIQHASDKVLPFGSADWQLHPRLHPGEGDLVVHKQHGNAFEDTPLHAIWPARGRPRHRDGPGDAWLRQGDVPGRVGVGLQGNAGGRWASSYSKDAARFIEEWNRKLSEAGAMVAPAAQIAFGGPP